jgi:CRISPR-associated endonuclease Csn1
MTEQLPHEYILGIDLGTNSLGWAIIGLIDGEPAQIVRAGARVFEAGMEGNIQSGQEESRNLKRRQMRLQRRQTWRRARRLKKICNLLQHHGLLPAGDASTPEKRQDLINELDKTIRASDWFKARAASGKFPEPGQTLPYILRAAALDEPLEPQFLGRALYHLAQRRGYKSNRKAPPQKDEKPGEVEKGIGEIVEGMAQSGSRTLGEYLATLDPFVRRIRQRWTARSMYQEEFQRVWEKQATYRPDELTSERRKQLHTALFFQRRLWFPRSLVGTCALEPEEPRAPKHSYLAQRFRLLDSVNNLKLDSGITERDLAPEERAKLVQELELHGDLTFSHVRKKLLNLPKGSIFTIERGGEKTLRGNRTTSQFYKVFGERWLEMSAIEHDQALQDILSIENRAALERRGLNHWKLDADTAKKFASIKLEPDYFNWSARAMQKLLPLLETGTTAAAARHEVYPEAFQARPPLPLLPALQSPETRQATGEIRNPAVMRSLTEFRKVVNSIIRRHGKPVEVRIELARDLKRSRKDRKRLSDRMRDNEKARENAKRRILQAEGNPHPRRDDILKALLWEECDGICPYTGKPIPFKNLFGDAPQFDIEHIIPRERCFDYSFSNLTLCDSHENRHVKGGRTPWEAYGNTEKWEQILDRVGRFHSESARAKLRRFQMTETTAAEFIDKFLARQLNDTRYASRLAAKYAAMLYGGLSDDLHQRRVHVTSGEVTAKLRSAWNLNGILNDGPTTDGGEARKTREDHRHHAVDAVAIALTSDSTIQGLSRVAAIARERAQRKLDSLEGPWPDFVDSVRAEIDKIVVSHRLSKKVSGPLHEETLYSRPIGEKGEVRVRKPLDRLTPTEVGDIADESIKKLVMKKMEELGGGKPDKLFSKAENLPRFPSSGVVIKNVRITKPERPTVVGNGRAQRHVISGNNHHVEIYAELDGKGNEKQWDGEVVPMMDAYQRLKAGKPIVQRDHGPLVAFKFSLAKGDTVELQGDDGQKSLWVVRKIGSQVSLISVNDARRIEKYFSPRINGLFKRRARKVAVNPLGEVTEAHD